MYRIASVEIIKALLFDLDGVLLLSSPIHQRAYDEVLTSCGFPPYPYEEIAGMRTDGAFLHITRTYGQQISQEQLKEMVDQKRKRAYALLIEQKPVAPACQQTLMTLSSRFQLALVSSASRRHIDLFLQISDCADLFRFVISGEDVRCAKPDPEIYRRCLADLRLDPNCCVAIEDAVSGIDAAQSAGIPVIAKTGSVARHLLEEAGAMAIIEQLDELPGLLL